ncbi:MAG TPA: DJ-1/PfpI family protein [Thermoanaerobaculia bacterium]|nr:DJ-1/PfpI family protein [Thermoanaerobaculia bacterium]
MQVVCILFPDFTQLDLTGPYEVFHRLPRAEVRLVAASTEPVVSEGGLAIVPDATFAEEAACDVLFVPGGPGVNDAMLDETLIAFVRRHGERAAFVTSACTGALILGAAGLLAGYEAATHWASMEYLQAFGAWPKRERVVVSGNRITGGGVTAGIDIALRIAEATHGRAVAEEVQLAIEYTPQPPFDAGSPETAPAAVREAVLARLAPMQAVRREAVAAAAKKLSS